ncbi:MAG: hypothetical protein Q8P53_01170 [Candidatus Shapirobacteria bacterium]|nr:hypothetical protein [Candidatus Shapirobacteria bacterium]
MPQIVPALIFGFCSLLAYLFSITALVNFAPQLLALSAIIFLLILFKQKTFSLYSISFIVSLIIFTTGGLNSPVFFLIYFLLFTVAFQNPPSTTLGFSLILIILLSQSLNSSASLLPLFSLLFITPLAWFVGRQYLDNQKLGSLVSKDETEVLLWLSLNFKNSIIKIIDSVSILMSTAKLSPSQKEQLDNINHESKTLLKSSQKLSREIDQSTDDED